MQPTPENQPVEAFDSRNAFTRFRKITLGVLFSPRTFLPLCARGPLWSIPASSWPLVSWFPQVGLLMEFYRV
jgi:hypothetical protein